MENKDAYGRTQVVVTDDDGAICSVRLPFAKLRYLHLEFLYFETFKLSLEICDAFDQQFFYRFGVAL
ncbi:hypothetical protein RHGRI_011881 [Rhododendron griersonianum]|uniref:Uncharacterized protein n=1 Tax=Rhododendron griersonianum TaxID=479676 RepID=A0AAV6KNJ9_9ERIC|nr:hypothetical protein RHGRI_011881 [Rhododendron griersonianum]